MQDVVKSGFDRRFDTIFILLADYFQSIGPISLIEQLALIRALENIYESELAYQTAMSKMPKKVNRDG